MRTGECRRVLGIVLALMLSWHSRPRLCPPCATASPPPKTPSWKPSLVKLRRRGAGLCCSTVTWRLRTGWRNWSRRYGTYPTCQSRPPLQQPAPRPVPAPPPTHALPRPVPCQLLRRRHSARGLLPTQSLPPYSAMQRRMPVTTRCAKPGTSAFALKTSARWPSRTPSGYGSSARPEATFHQSCAGCAPAATLLCTFRRATSSPTMKPAALHHGVSYKSSVAGLW